ncbi:hypothetical protein Blue_027 [Bacillus phage Deep Blue]|uniref:Uncharacterized protein n=1 Tax=Bacillus phage Deep Blue TaxID=1792245 RepID=A0A140HLI8_9CAUD|nr:hypothetical protein Blue_027 [Bacillus phage Deep Blue]AMO25850.1 hypothetical protein Blue_027 [Bacillus phage Deep Blue]
MTELNCNEVVSQWGNFGDNDPIEYGTKFVKADVEQENCFYVVEISTPWATGDNFYLSKGYVDLNDDWINWKDIRRYAGNEITHEETAKEYQVSALVDYYGIHEFNGEPLTREFPVCENGLRNVVITEAEALFILKDFGIIVEGSEEVITVTTINYNESRIGCFKASDIESIGETVDGEGVINLDDDTTIIVSESLERLEIMLGDFLEEYDITVITGEEEEDDNE